MSDNHQHIEKLLAIYQSRLQKLEQRAALTGPRTEPEVLIEIEDLEETIRRTKARLAYRGYELRFGPHNTSISHSSDGYLQTVESNVSARNVLVEADFVNPYASSTHGWNAAIVFRKETRIWIDSDQMWGYGHYLTENWRLISRGKSSIRFNHNMGETNTLRVIANGDLGRFFVNNQEVGELDLSETPHPTIIKVGISERKCKQHTCVTYINNFTVYRSLE